MSVETKSMTCPKCNSRVRRQNGKNSEFYFCPNQNACGQGTLSVNRIVIGR